MRVIAGTFRSRALVSPRGDNTRPTSDRLRETLFNVLASRIPGSKFVDLYAGAGAVGIEAISRGTSFCWFAENARPAAMAIRQNLSALGIRGGYALEDRGVDRLLRNLAQSLELADIVFLDPPYAAAGEYTSTLETLGSETGSLLGPAAIVVVEHARKQPTLAQYGALSRYRVLEQGDAALSFYRAAETVTD